MHCENENEPALFLSPMSTVVRPQPRLASGEPAASVRTADTVSRGQQQPQPTLPKSSGRTSVAVVRPRELLRQHSDSAVDVAVAAAAPPAADDLYCLPAAAGADDETGLGFGGRGGLHGALACQEEVRAIFRFAPPVVGEFVAGVVADWAASAPPPLRLVSRQARSSSRSSGAGATGVDDSANTNADDRDRDGGDDDDDAATLCWLHGALAGLRCVVDGPFLATRLRGGGIITSARFITHRGDPQRDGGDSGGRAARSGTSPVVCESTATPRTTATTPQHDARSGSPAALSLSARSSCASPTAAAANASCDNPRLARSNAFFLITGGMSAVDALAACHAQFAAGMRDFGARHLAAVYRALLECDFAAYVAVQQAACDALLRGLRAESARLAARQREWEAWHAKNAQKIKMMTMMTMRGGGGADGGGGGGGSTTTPQMSEAALALDCCASDQQQVPAAAAADDDIVDADSDSGDASRRRAATAAAAAATAQQRKFAVVVRFARLLAAGQVAVFCYAAVSTDLREYVEDCVAQACRVQSAALLNFRRMYAMRDPAGAVAAGLATPGSGCACGCVLCRARRRVVQLFFGVAPPPPSPASSQSPQSLPAASTAHAPAASSPPPRGPTATAVQPSSRGAGGSVAAPRKKPAPAAAPVPAATGRRSLLD